MSDRKILTLLTLVAVVLLATPGAPQAALPQQAVALADYDRSHEAFNGALLEGLRFRNVGPYRGGRVTAVAGVPGKLFTFFFGATGGGLWRTDNAGHTWDNVSDGFFAAGPVGAVEVAAADPNVIYVGTGSACIRGNVSIGVGVYGSTDMGRTWRFLGLPDAGVIGRILTHPRDPDLVYVAALGNPFGPNPERGVYRSRDGGASWEQVLFASEQTGAVDLAMDPSNPRVLYAAMWHGERKPWTMISGSEDGGLFKSTDGGDTWTEVGGGFPDGLVGRIGVTVSPADSSRVWAIVEASDDRSGVYRSDDAGATWSRVSAQGNVVSRPWYYMHIEADPRDANTVYALNSGFYRSIDGGQTFASIPMPHSDHHDLWVDPGNTDVMLMGNDGGATLSLDGGRTWSPQLNQPTAELYSVTVDDAFPYRIYGPQQDNSTISVPSATSYSGISLQHWLSVGGCETGPIAIKPDNPDIYYAGCFGGRLARYDRSTEQFRQIRDYPEEMAGMPESALRYRIQWNAPITTSRHDPSVLYHGSQYVHRTTNEGQSWEVISPDLTGSHTEMLGPAGGPITHDITGVEIYSALLAIEEDIHDVSTLWTGSNDGVVSVSRDRGATWSTVTPSGLPELSTVNRIDPSPHRAGKAYVAAYRYRMDDWAPYVFRTDDFGASWKRIADGNNGIPPDWPVRVVREDPEREGLLYAGTEFGLFVSFDDGGRWQPLQLNLPRVPVTDLRVHRGDLVVATQGRSFWVLDDLTPLHQMADEAAAAVAWLFTPRAAYRTGATTSNRDYPRDHVYGAMLPRGWLGENPPAGAILYYALPGDPEETLELEILDVDGKPVRRYSSDEERTTLPARPGLNRFVWDLRYSGPDLGEQGGFFAPSGPRAVPGVYQVVLSRGDWSAIERLEVRKDPRLTYVTVEDLQLQFDFLQRVLGNIERLERARGEIGAAREQMAAVRERIGEVENREAILESIERMGQDLDLIEGELVQTSGGGWANEAKIRRNLFWLASAASSQRGEQTDARPTDQLLERLADVESALQEQLESWEMIVDHELDDLNLMLMAAGVPAVSIVQG